MSASTAGAAGAAAAAPATPAAPLSLSLSLALRETTRRLPCRVAGGTADDRDRDDGDNHRDHDER